MSTKKVGHMFLAELGKKRLRPGGVEATNWLFEQGDFSEDTKVLEVACNMGTTLLELAERYHCQVIGVDLDKKALEKAQQAIKKAKLQHLVRVQQGNALKLPFDDNSFDIVMNEAMLTMLDNKSKSKALAEYYRVLKPGGKLLTHDICLKGDTKTQQAELSKTINMRVAPLTITDWQQQYQLAGFEKINYQTGKMSLMSPIGLIRDEGLKGAFTIARNGLKADNRAQFLELFRYFRKQKQNLRYIAHCAEK